LYHALLYGVAKDFVNWILDPITREEMARKDIPWWKVTKEGRALIVAREANIVAVSEYGHAHGSVIKDRNHWTMDQWLHFFLTWSTLIFAPGDRPNNQGPLHDDVFEMFVNLRAAIKYFCVMDVPDASATQEAVEALKRYTIKAEEAVKKEGVQTPKGCIIVKLLSFNLHILNCRLYEQEQARGHVAFENELWIERVIQALKQSTKYRVGTARTRGCQLHDD